MTRTRESARLLQQVNLFHLELFTSKLVLVKRQLEEEASRSRRKRKKRLWARSWLLRRPLYGQYEKLMHELTSEDVSGYKNFLRMDPEMFHRGGVLGIGNFTSSASGNRLGLANTHT